jgi:hypothetical protein
MKTIYRSLRLIFQVIPVWALCLQSYSQKVIFLHHSTGENVYYEGKVKEWIDDFNLKNKCHIDITERAFPNEPYEWKNYPFDYWNLWINQACEAGKPGIECINTLCRDYKMIILKHCFPGADILEDTGNQDVASERKSLENYKVQYRALLDMMDKYPDNLFIVWTLAPLHRLATTPENAARAKEFVGWVKNEWLTEDGRNHENILIFDFWGLTAAQEEMPGHEQVNCLRYEYEKSHDSGDSHPNVTANEAVGPVFARFITGAFKEK